MDTEEKPAAKAKPNDILDSVSIAAFDLDGRIFRTLWHSLTRTPDVALAGVKGDFSEYLSPIRVFVALFSFQFVVASLFGTPLAGSLEQLTVAIEPEGGGQASLGFANWDTMVRCQCSAFGSCSGTTQRPVGVDRAGVTGSTLSSLRSTPGSS